MSTNQIPESVSVNSDAKFIKKEKDGYPVRVFVDKRGFTYNFKTWLIGAGV
ncbi:hypothetical protein H7T43_19355 [Peribacillus simplex]|nr:hypothetical protein [Peribacillus simplex]